MPHLPLWALLRGGGRSVRRSNTTLPVGWGHLLVPLLPLWLTVALTTTGPSLIHRPTSLHPTIAIPSDSSSTTITTTTTASGTTTVRGSITSSLTLPPFRTLEISSGAHVSNHISPHLLHYVGTLLWDHTWEYRNIERHSKNLINPEKKKKKEKKKLE